MMYNSGMPPPPAFAPQPVVNFDVIGEAWEMLRARLSVWLSCAFVVLLINFLVGLVLQLPEQYLIKQPPAGSSPAASMGLFVGIILWAAVVKNIITGVVGFMLIACTVRLAMAQMRGEEIARKDLFKIGDIAGPVFLTAILLMLSGFVGALLCCLPAFVFGGLFMLTMPLVVDARMEPVAAMKASWNALKGQWLMATGFYLVVTILSASGTFACCIGFIFTYPFMPLCTVLMYRNFFLSGQEYVPPVAPTYPM